MSIKVIWTRSAHSRKCLEYKDYIVVFRSNNDEEEIETEIKISVMMVTINKQVKKVKVTGLSLSDWFRYDPISKELAEKIIADKKYANMNEKQILSLVY